VANLGGASHTGVGLGGSGGMGRPGSELPSTGITRNILFLAILFRIQNCSNSCAANWQQLPNWKSATVKGFSWEGTAEEYARKYTDLVGVEDCMRG
jgi:hypothetical protein